MTRIALTSAHWTRCRRTAPCAPYGRRWVEDFRDRLRDAYGDRIRDLRLFGSKARGEVHDESDIDLLVLVEGDEYDTRQATVDLASAISPWLAPQVSDFELYHAPVSRATGFYKELRRESVRL